MCFTPGAERRSSPSGRIRHRPVRVPIISPLPLAAALLVAGVLPASANVLWPALIMEQRLFSPLVIIIGFAVEWAVIRYVFDVPTLGALWASLAANAASMAVGFIGRPFLGFFWSILPSLLGHATFSPLDWAGTFLVTVLVNVAIEAPVLRYGFALPMPWRNLGWIALVNAVTIGAAYASTAVFPLDWH